jgi:hypothetical protein
MDTESPWDKGSEQYNFILDELENSQSFDHKIIISHKNFITCDCSHRPLPGLYGTYHDLFAKHDVDFVFSGHNHNYQRFSPIDNVTYIVNGLGGALPYELEDADHKYEKRFDDTYGYLELNIENQRSSGKFISNSDTIRDNFTLTG